MAAVDFTYCDAALSFPSDLLPSDKCDTLTFVAAVARRLDHVCSGPFQLQELCAAILLAAADNEHVTDVSCLFKALALLPFHVTAPCPCEPPERRQLCRGMETGLARSLPERRPRVELAWLVSPVCFRSAYADKPLATISQHLFLLSFHLNSFFVADDEADSSSQQAIADLEAQNHLSTFRDNAALSFRTTCCLQRCRRLSSAPRLLRFLRTA
jgi:hypothetical protein